MGEGGDTQAEEMTNAGSEARTTEFYPQASSRNAQRVTSHLDPIQLIPQQWVARMRHVEPYLVGPPACIHVSMCAHQSLSFSQ